MSGGHPQDRARDLARVDQFASQHTEVAATLMGAAFRAFCAQEGITREDAARLAGEWYRALGDWTQPKDEPS